MGQVVTGHPTLMQMSVSLLQMLLCSGVTCRLLLGRAVILGAHSVCLGLISQGLNPSPPCIRSQGRALPQRPCSQAGMGMQSPGRRRPEAAPDWHQCGSWSHLGKKSAPSLLGRRRQYLKDRKGNSVCLCNFGQLGRGVAWGQAQAVALTASAMGPAPLWPGVCPHPSAHGLGVSLRGWGRSLQLPGQGDVHSTAKGLGPEWDGQGRGSCSSTTPEDGVPTSQSWMAFLLHTLGLASCPQPHGPVHFSLIILLQVHRDALAADCSTSGPGDSPTRAVQWLCWAEG